MLSVSLAALPTTAVGQDAPADDDTPVVSDEDFNTALEPLESFDLTLPEETATVPEPVAPPVDGETPAEATLPPTPLPEDTVLTEETALKPDAEMDAALAPIDGFDVEPLRTAATETTEDAPELRYQVSVEGLDDKAIRNRFTVLSALYQGEKKAANVGMLRARARQDETLMVKLLKAEGYYDAQARGVIQTVEDRPSDVQVRLFVTPGRPYSFGAIQITAPDGAPVALIRQALTVQTGERIEADRVLAAEANIRTTLPRVGYPFVTVGTRDIALDPATHTGDYNLVVSPGPRSVFGTYRSEPSEGGKLAFGDDHVVVLSRIEPGTLYNNDKVDDLRQTLASTGLFRSVSVEPVRTGKLAPDGSEIVDLRIVQTAGPARTLAAEAGYSTGQGLTLKGSWGHRNLFPPEGALALSATAGTQEQAVAIVFRRSNAGRRDRTLTLSGGYSHNNYDSYEAFTTSLSASVARLSTPTWQKVWSWSLGAELLSTRESDPDVLGVNVFRTYELATFPTLLTWDKSNDLLNPTTGFRLTGQATPQLSFRQDQASSFKVQGDAAYYYPLADNMSLAGRVRLGVLTGGSLLDIAPSRRIYGGGGGSVRGFSYQALGPLDVNGDPTGGLSVVEGAIELRYQLKGEGFWKDLGVVPFIDVGQVYGDELPDFSDLRVGVGVGARYYTPFGPIRIDVATPLSRRDNESAFTLYVGIGQAF